MPGALESLPGAGIASDEVLLGHVLGSFGIRGELRLFLFHPASDLWQKPQDLIWVSPQGHRFRGALRVRPGTGKRMLGQLAGITTPEAADALAEWQLVVPASRLPKTGTDEYYVRDLIGMGVEIEGTLVGKVTDVQATAGGDVLVVRAGTEPHFVPFVRAWVLGVDVAARMVQLAPGALEDL